MVWKTFTKFCEHAQCFASLLDAYHCVEDNTFVWAMNHSPHAPGSFGKPLEYVNMDSDTPVIQEPVPGLKIREFEHATIMVNLNDSQVTYNSMVFNPRSSRVIWR